LNSQEWREAVLEGASAAARLHEQLSLREQLSTGQAPVDVFRIISDIGVSVICRPLVGLLGVFLPRPVGMIITTNRDLHVQRYTAAHELGHFLLSHQASLDDDQCIGFVARGGSHQNPQEVAADSFASELLAPRWLVQAVVERQGWSSLDLREAGTVYQLSLRLGISYSATCWCLLSHRVLDRNNAANLARVPPKTSKRQVLGGEDLGDSWADVWSLSARDDGALLMGSPNDMIRLELPEHGASGSTWNLEPALKNGLELISDTLMVPAGDAIGGSVARRLTLRGGGSGRVRIEERRQWDEMSPAVASFEVEFSFLGKEQGAPRVTRKWLH